MPAKLLITRENDFNWREEKEFGQDIITIGRGKSNILILNDHDRVVSRSHAKLKFQEGSYYVMDCSSRNATYLNNRKIPSNKPQLLKEGDQIKIGDYILHCKSLTEEVKSPASYDSTVVLVNAFDEDLRIFAGVMNKIKRTFDNENPENREDQLKTALYRTLTFIELGKVGEIFAEGLFTKRPGVAEQAVIKDVKSERYETKEQAAIEAVPKVIAKVSPEMVAQIGATAKDAKVQNDRPSLISLYKQRKTSQRKWH